MRKPTRAEQDLHEVLVELERAEYALRQAVCLLTPAQAETFVRKVRRHWSKQPRNSRTYSSRETWNWACRNEEVFEADM